MYLSAATDSVESKAEQLRLTQALRFLKGECQHLLCGKARIRTGMIFMVTACFRSLIVVALLPRGRPAISGVYFTLSVYQFRHLTESGLSAYPAAIEVSPLIFRTF